jgi:hypothetical protein
MNDADLFLFVIVSVIVGFGLALLAYVIFRARSPAARVPVAPRNIIHVVSVETSKEIPVPPVDHMPDFTLPSTSVSAGLALVNPRYVDGTRVPPTTISWETSDATALPIEVLPDSTVKDAADADVLDPADGLPLNIHNVLARTPLTPAPGDKVEGVVTAKAAGMFDVDIKVVYGDPALGHMAITAAIIPE